MNIQLLGKKTIHRFHQMCVFTLGWRQTFDEKDGLIRVFFPDKLMFLLSQFYVFDDLDMHCVFSIGVSVKMNVLLFGPALLILLLVRHGLPGTIKLLSVCAAIQVNTSKSVSYLSKR